MKRIISVARDLFVDGYSFIGVIAPTLSIGFALAKAFEILPNLREVSYLWALVPILGWVLVAYVRRWLAHAALSERLAKANVIRDQLRVLGEVRDRGVQLRNRKPETSMYVAWVVDYDDWRTEAYEAALAASPVLHDRIKTLDSMGPAPQGIAIISPEHDLAVRVMSEILRRIDQYLQSHQ